MQSQKHFGKGLHESRKEQIWAYGTKSDHLMVGPLIHLLLLHASQPLHGLIERSHAPA